MQRKTRPLQAKTWFPFVKLRVPLALADSEHLCAANWAHTLGSWFAILHLNSFGAAHLSLFATLHTIGLHSVHLLFLR